MHNNKHFGTLKVYDPIKGYGFITRQTGKDVFVFFHDFEKGEDASAVAGVQVQFEIKQKSEGKGPRAVKVKILG